MVNESEAAIVVLLHDFMSLTTVMLVYSER